MAKKYDALVTAIGAHNLVKEGQALAREHRTRETSSSSGKGWMTPPKDLVHPGHEQHDTSLVGHAKQGAAMDRLHTEGTYQNVLVSAFGKDKNEKNMTYHREQNAQVAKNTAGDGQARDDHGRWSK